MRKINKELINSLTKQHNFPDNFVLQHFAHANMDARRACVEEVIVIENNSNRKT